LGVQAGSAAPKRRAAPLPPAALTTGAVRHALSPSRHNESALVMLSRGTVMARSQWFNG